MAEDQYSNREIDSHFKTVNDGIGEVNRLVVSIDGRVAIQNGRVAKLEGKSAWMAGVGAAAIFLFGIIGGLIVYSFQLSQENLKNTILIEVGRQVDEIGDKVAPRTPTDIQKRIEELQAETQLLETQIQ